jgi:hypothetical protein
VNDEFSESYWTRVRLPPSPPFKNIRGNLYMANPRKRKARILAALQKVTQEQSPSANELDEMVKKARELVNLTEQLTEEQIENALSTNEDNKDGEKKQIVDERKETPVENPKKPKPAKKRTRKRTTKPKK